ncbi:MAG: C-terminal helicase domain-containing protein [Syntrophorhabdales bacterium]
MNHPAHYARRGRVASELSGKAKSTIAILGKVLDRGEKALVFTQYRRMGDLLVTMFRKELNETAFFYHGGLSRKERDKTITAFRDRIGRAIMVIQLKAGGTGINLDSANHAIHYDMWWNPAVEDQGSDRAFRIGQKKNVTVYRLITKGTLEERINELLKSKRVVSEMVLEGRKEIRSIAKYSDKQLEELIRLRAQSRPARQNETI